MFAVCPCPQAQPADREHPKLSQKRWYGMYVALFISAGALALVAFGWLIWLDLVDSPGP